VFQGYRATCYLYFSLMASFSAELHIAGHVFPVTHCHFDVTQATQLRGRVSAKVRYGPVQLVLDVPDGDVLPAWAADPHKRQATAIVFLDATGGQPLETLRLPATYCVAYQEQFSSGDAAGGAYQCFLTLSDPSGWTLAPGGPATAFVATGNHGEPGAVARAGAMVLNTVSRNSAIGGDGRPNSADSVLFSSQAIDSSSNPSPIVSEEDIAKLFENPDLLDLHNKISAGLLPRRHDGIISVEEQAVIAYYTTAAGYRQFNLALRGQAPMTEFFRAQERILNGALEKLPKFQGSTIRGTGESETQRFASAKDGDVIEYENFVSSSTEEIIADDFMQRKKGEYVLRITSKNGVQITDMSMAQAEEEILFQSKKKFQVTGKSFRPRFTEDDPLIREVYLEEI
jgi:hypothetical protein